MSPSQRAAALVSTLIIALACAGTATGKFETGRSDVGAATGGDRWRPAAAGQAADKLAAKGKQRKPPRVLSGQIVATHQRYKPEPDRDTLDWDDTIVWIVTFVRAGGNRSAWKWKLGDVSFSWQFTYYSAHCPETGEYAGDGGAERGVLWVDKPRKHRNPKYELDFEGALSLGPFPTYAQCESGGERSRWPVGNTRLLYSLPTGRVRPGWVVKRRHSYSESVYEEHTSWELRPQR